MYAFVGLRLPSIIFWNYNKRSRMNYEFLYRIILSKMLRFATVSPNFHRIFIENGIFRGKIGKMTSETVILLQWFYCFGLLFFLLFI